MAIKSKRHLKLTKDVRPGLRAKKICTTRKPTPFFHRVLFYSVTHLYGVAHWKIEVHRVFSRQKHLVHKRFSARVLKTNLWEESKQGSRVHLLFYFGGSGPGFESRSAHLMDLFSIVSSSNPRPRL